MSVPESKGAAILLGERFFRTGKLCPKGHDGVRYTRGGTCVECVRMANAAKASKPFTGIGPLGLSSIARAGAARAGETTYVSDRPCPKGHTTRGTSWNNCIECQRLARARDGEVRRWSRIKSLYGITKGEYEALVREQQGRCAICPDSLPADSRTHVDHCHATGHVRGLLCGPCNQAIGLLREDPQIMRRAIAYVSA